MGATDNRVRAGGLTMVELVVVMAIIGLMAAIAIPSFTRMGLFSGNELQDSAREIYTLLRAARAYAGTYNVDAALVYSPYRSTDTGISSLRAVAIMYRPQGDPDLFVPVPREDQGQFRELPRDTMVLAEAGFPPGTESITIHRDNEDADDPESYAAHVFDPSGRLRQPKGMKERYTFQVCYGPDASAEERLVDPNRGEFPDNLRSIAINLYRATGRVEISND